MVRVFLPSLVAGMFLIFVMNSIGTGAEEDPRIKGKQLSKLVKQLQSSNKGLQVRAARTLSEAPEKLHETIIPKLIPLLRDKRENTRPWAAQALGEYGPKSRAAVPDLLPLLKGTQYERNRASAAKALGQILKDTEPSEEVDTVVAEMIRLFADQYPDVRREAYTALGSIGLSAKACIPHLTKPMKDAGGGNSLTRSLGREAVYTCGVFGKLSAEHIDLLISLMHAGPVPEVIEAIGKIGPIHENVVPNIVDRMEKVSSGSVMVREGSRTHKMSGELVQRNMEEGFKALAKFGPQSAPAVDAMVHYISSKKWERKKGFAIGALKVLGAIGPKAKSALPTIEKNCIPSQDEEIKKAATEAVEKIQSKEK